MNLAAQGGDRLTAVLLESKVDRLDGAVCVRHCVDREPPGQAAANGSAPPVQSASGRVVEWPLSDVAVVTRHQLIESNHWLKRTSPLVSPIRHVQLDRSALLIER